MLLTFSDGSTLDVEYIGKSIEVDNALNITVITEDYNSVRSICSNKDILSSITTETGEVYKDKDGNELTGKRKELENYILSNTDFQKEYLEMLNKHIQADDVSYGDVLDARETAEIKKQEAAVEGDIYLSLKVYILLFLYFNLPNIPLTSL